MFSSLKENNSIERVDLGDDAKYQVTRFGIVPFQLYSINVLYFNDVFCVLSFRKNIILVLVMEDSGFAIEFITITTYASCGITGRSTCIIARCLF